MSFINLTKVAIPSTPATDTNEIFVDAADNKLKQLDSNGVLSVLVNDGCKNKNIITNGGFNIQQKCPTTPTAVGALSATTRVGQVANRWSVTPTVISNVSWAQIDTAAAPETGLPSRYYGSMISASAGKKLMLSQFIINSEMAHLRGQDVRVSVKTNIKVGNAQTLRLGLVQLNASGTVDVCPTFLASWSTSTGVDPVFGTNLVPIAPDPSPSGENGTISGNFLSIAAQQTTWIRSSCVFTIPSTAKNLIVVLFSDATSGATDNISVAEFQLTLGSDIVDYVEPAIAETLLRCQRFYCKSFPLTVVPAAAVAVATAGNGVTNIITRAGATALASYINIQFPIKMHRTPTCTLFAPVGAGAVPYRHSGTTPAVQTAVAQTGLTDTGVVVSSTGDVNGAVGDLVGVHFAADCDYVN